MSMLAGASATAWAFRLAGQCCVGTLLDLCRASFAFLSGLLDKACWCSACSNAVLLGSRPGAVRIP